MVIPIERHAFQIKDGVLSVLEAGAAGGKPVVLLHGVPTNANLFRSVLPILADVGYHAIAPDMPGYGETRLSDMADYSISAVADLIAAWIQAEKRQPIWLVGHDLGGAVAQLIAVRYPELVSRLTMGNCPIGDSFPVTAVNLAILAAKTGLFIPFTQLGLIPNFYMNGEIRRGFANPSHLTADMMKTVFWDGKVNEQRGRQEFAKHLKHLRNTESVEIVPQLAQVPMPTFVLWSDTDRHQPFEVIGQRLLRALPAGTPFDVVTNAGHFMPLEAPAVYSQKLLMRANE
ncbi:MAG: alpha/beta fold hydrolase [Anaerolineaceae bacterium]|nr:alpha/beta fold hydrolase [Anaerolineaceae bacterium]